MPAADDPSQGPAPVSPARQASSASRFRRPPDPRFWALNRSLPFDWRLAAYDIDQSQAHARGLHGVGVLDDEELERIVAGLDRVRARMGEHGFAFEEADEDIHMAIERLLGEEIGPLAGKLHTGRSRNDQVATDVALVVQAHSLRAIELCGAAMERLLALAESHRDWPMPGYTHLQRAQPVYLGHHLLAYFWMLARDVLRFQFALDSAGVMPLGSGALAGVNWEIDREAVAADLGFQHVTHNSIDGASNRDFVLDYLAAASACAMHLSRLGSEVVIWSSSEFGFCRLDESFSSGSSIMPQKVNPDSAELLRAKSPRVGASYATLLGVMHALPLTYGKDMQEDKEPLFDAIDTVELCLDATAGMLDGIEFDRGRMEAASGDEMLAATEVADLLVRRGVPFREAHGIVGALVRDAVEAGKTLSELTPEELRRHSEQLDDSYYEVLRRGSWLESKRIAGGTGSVPLTAQLAAATETLEAVRARVREERA
jgi:argininosuccinate lyase